MAGQRVSNWVPTGGHSFCPQCGNGNVDVAYFVYADKEPGWEYRCYNCGGTGPGEMKNDRRMADATDSQE